jgi:hypothetical protein
VAMVLLPEAATRAVVGTSSDHLATNSAPPKWLDRKILATTKVNALRKGT